LGTITMPLQGYVNYAIHYAHNAVKDRMPSVIIVSHRLSYG